MATLICKVCSGNNFSKESGLYYCTDCQTQVEGWREEDVDFGHQSSLASGRVRLSILKAKGFKSDGALTKSNLPWSTWELYNYLLESQVTQLEHLPGVAPSFRFIVLTLWTRFLQKSGYAFLRDKALPPSSVATCRRDIAVFTATSLAVLSRKRQKLRKKRETMAGSTQSLTGSEGSRMNIVKFKRALMSQVYEDQSMQHSESTSHVTFDVDFLSESNLSSIMSSQGSSFDDSASESRCSEDILTNFQLKKVNTELDRQTLICILYLGLLLTKSEAVLLDLMRWAKGNHVNYLDILNIFPHTVKLMADDRLRFGAIFMLPSISKMQQLVVNISQVIGIKEIPTPDICALAERFIKELQLPDMLIQQVKKLIRKYPPNLLYIRNASKQLKYFECHAMAFVVVLLKLLFSLDGVQELYWSKVAETSNQKCKMMESFVWEQWVQWIEVRNTLISHHTTMDRVLHSYEEQGAENEEVTSRVLSGFSKKNLESQLLKLCSNESACASPKPEKFEVPPTLTPFCDAVNLLKRNIGTLPQIFELDFTSTKVDFILQTSEDTRKAESSLQNHRLEEKTYPIIKNNTNNVKVKIGKNKKTVNAKESMKYKDAIKSCNVSPHESYWFLPIISIPDGNTKSAHIEFTKIKCKLPNSFLWLLEQCAHILSDSPAILYSHVCNVEIKIALDGDCMDIYSPILEHLYTYRKK